MIIVGFVGLIGSGKDTSADYLVNFHGFRRESFASSLKDAVSFIFGWDRTLLEGRTTESRHWREQVDEWWATKLEIPHLTPRWILQHWGTDVLRNNFHDSIWIASLENKINKSKDNVVISDVRFPNEIKSIKSMGGIIIRIKRGPDPSWFEIAKLANSGNEFAKKQLSNLGIHNSESSWAGTDFDYVVDNNSTIDNLFGRINDIISLESNSLVSKAS